MQSLSFPKKLKIPVWSWLGQTFGLCLCVFFLGFSVWMLLQAKHSFGWIFFIAALLAILASGLKAFRQTIMVNEVLMLEDGLQKKMRGRTVFYRWEDVTRYQPYRLDFALFFTDGERIRFPVEMKDSREIKEFILQSLEEIGTFEDGRNGPRVVASISIKALLWIGIAVGAAIMLTIFR